MLTSYYTKEIIEHQGVNVNNIKETEEIIEIHIEKQRKANKCPICGRMTDKIHDYRIQIIKELPAFGKKVRLVLRKRRYRCECGKRFSEETEIVARYQRMTAKYILAMLNKLHETYSYSSVAREFDVSTTTVIRYFNTIQYNKPKELPEAIGIDEFKGNTGGEKFNCILTDLTNGKVFDILRTRYQHDLIDYFKQYSKEERAKVKYFVSDMYATYAEIAKTYFPNAEYITDKYHWVRQTIWAIEKVRKEVQQHLPPEQRKYFKHSRWLLLKHWDKLSDDDKQRLNVMLYYSSDLSGAHFLKELLYKINSAGSTDEACRLFKEWIHNADSCGTPAFEKCAATYRHWFNSIINSIKYPYSNGFTEGCNNKIKVLKRNAYGFSNFKRFRNRILFIFS